MEIQFILSKTAKSTSFGIFFGHLCLNHSECLFSSFFLFSFFFFFLSQLNFCFPNPFYICFSQLNFRAMKLKHLEQEHSWISCWTNCPASLFPILFIYLFILFFFSLFLLVFSFLFIFIFYFFRKANSNII